MKYYLVQIFLFLLFSFTISTICFAQATKIEKPCDEKSNVDYIKVTGWETSDDFTVANEIAILVAQEKLASSIESRLERIVKRYVRSVDKKVDYKKFEKAIKGSLDQVIGGYEISCEEEMELKDGSYRAFVTLALPRKDTKEDLFEEMEEMLEKEEDLKLNDKNKERFEQIFEEEMEKI